MRERARGKVEFSAETRRRQISLAETAGGEEEFPSRLEAKSSGQRAGELFRADISAEFIAAITQLWCIDEVTLAWVKAN